jgi:(1->4)-alpha-D-glucan 1-alpha-D-glucosylmutase
MPSDANAARRSAGDSLWTSTYRLQLHRDFPLDAACEILPYLRRLGITHVYLSPCLQAGAGSQHGYDVTDYTRISEDLGGEEAWDRLICAARNLKLKLLLDIVPNHMAASAENAWWDDVLAQGPYSAHADVFDVRMPAGAPLRVQLCMLSRAYGDVLQAGELKIEYSVDRLRLRHFEQTWPLSGASWACLCGADDPQSAPRQRADADPFARLNHLRQVAVPSDTERESYQQCLAQATSQLQDWHDSGKLSVAMGRINENPSALDGLLQRQFYTLHSWTLSGELTNYRRFFEVNSLIGIRTELETVMRATHARIAMMLAREELDGLRIDHPDGLRDPQQYLLRLREMLPDGRVYVEKILDNDERLDQSWPVDGTVGYDFLAKVNRLWMDDRRLDALTATYNDFTGHSVNAGALVRQKQRAILESAFYADINRLTGTLIAIARTDWRTSDLSPRSLREALAAMTAALPVYRTYRTAVAINATDTRLIAGTVQATRLASPHIEPPVFDFLQALFTKPGLSDLESEFVAQWQQLTPAVMAKGVEDTTFYVYDRLVSCNEVGASASLLGISSDRFHEYCHYLSEHWPNSMLATSTHDNKRSEDVRTRISLLTEIPDRWTEALHHWSGLNLEAWCNRAPDRHAEYLFYQTMIGAWPLDQIRCWQYMLKATREAKIHTSWHQPHAAYEEKLRAFIENVFQNEEFIQSLQRFAAPLIRPGRINSLAQTLVKLVAPGVPDFYQGTELWDLSLVDPDNRRPVDYALRATMLQSCDDMGPSEALRNWDSGLPKLWLCARVLGFRGSHPQHFAPQSQYQPMVATGACLGNLLAFRRGSHLVVVVPRFAMTLQGDWQDTRLSLPDGEWRNLLGGKASLAAAVTPQQLFAEFPVALLVRAD